MVLLVVRIGRSRELITRKLAVVLKMIRSWERYMEFILSVARKAQSSVFP